MKTTMGIAREHRAGLAIGPALRKRLKRRRQTMSQETKDTILEVVGGLVLVVVWYALLVVMLCL